MDPVDRIVTFLFLRLANKIPTQLGSRRLRRLLDRYLNVIIIENTLHETIALHQVEDSPVLVDIMVLQVQQSSPRVTKFELMFGFVAFQEVIFDYPVDLSVQRERVLFDSTHAMFPHC